MATRKEKVLVISDLQFPFHHMDTFTFLKHMKRVHKPTRVVQIGDLFDFHALSDYPTHADADSANTEFDKSMEYKEQLMDIFPKMDILTSNHDVRLLKRLERAGIPSRFWPVYEELFECEGNWKFHDSLIIDNVEYIHGHQIASTGGNPMANAVKRRFKSTVFGHFHTRLGIDYLANEDDLYFGMCVGCLIDHKTYAFKYQRLAAKKPMVGIGLVDKGVPMIIAMPLNKKGRWIKPKGVK